MKRTTTISALVLAAVAATTLAVSAPVSAQDAGQGRPSAEQLFDRFDTNGDGQITQAEFEAVADARFADADTDGDGELSSDELVAAAEGRRAERIANRTERMIERLDTDGSGGLSQEELEAGRRGNFFDRLDADNDGVVTETEVAEARDDHRGRPGPGHDHGPRGPRNN